MSKSRLEKCGATTRSQVFAPHLLNPASDMLSKSERQANGARRGTIASSIYAWSKIRLTSRKIYRIEVFVLRSKNMVSKQDEKSARKMWRDHCNGCFRRPSPALGARSDGKTPAVIHMAQDKITPRRPNTVDKRFVLRKSAARWQSAVDKRALFLKQRSAVVKHC